MHFPPVRNAYRPMQNQTHKATGGACCPWYEPDEPHFQPRRIPLMACPCNLMMTTCLRTPERLLRVRSFLCPAFFDSCLLIQFLVHLSHPIFLHVSSYDLVLLLLFLTQRTKPLSRIGRTRGKKITGWFAAGMMYLHLNLMQEMDIWVEPPKSIRGTGCRHHWSWWRGTILWSLGLSQENISFVIIGDRGDWLLLLS